MVVDGGNIDWVERGSGFMFLFTNVGISDAKACRSGGRIMDCAVL